MRAVIRGLCTLNFKTSNGDAIEGTQVFFTYAANGVVGEKAEKIFLRKGFPIPPELAPGKMVDIFCDTKGRVEPIQLVAGK